MILSNLRHILLTMLLSVACTSVIAQSWVGKAAKSLGTLTTMRADGTLLASSTCCFAGGQGECVSAFTPFKGAASAIVIDGSGKRYDVTNMIAADDTYDLCRFTCQSATKVSPLSVAPAAATDGSEVFVLPYALKKPLALNATVSSSQTVADNSTYYTINLSLPQNAEAAPLFNSEGQLLAISQAGTADKCYAADVNIILSQQPSAFPSATLAMTAIPALLPSDFDQAQIALFMATQGTEDNYQRVTEQFIRQFPTHPEGFINRAQHNASLFTATLDRSLLSSISADVDKALQLSQTRDLTLCDVSRIIMQIALSDSLDAPFTLDDALRHIDQALEISKQSLFHYQRAQVLIAQQRWREAVFALNSYEELSPATAIDAQFYHQRYEAELQTRMYQQALDDLARAIDKDSHIPLLYIEQAQLLLRLGKFDEAALSAENAIAADATQAEGFLLLGVCQHKQGKLDEARKNLLIAQQKGSAEAQQYLEKLK